MYVFGTPILACLSNIFRLYVLCEFLNNLLCSVYLYFDYVHLAWLDRPLWFNTSFCLIHWSPEWLLNQSTVNGKVWTW